MAAQEAADVALAHLGAPQAAACAVVEAAFQRGSKDNLTVREALGLGLIGFGPPCCPPSRAAARAAGGLARLAGFHGDPQGL